jgi:hypothetical protein
VRKRLWTAAFAILLATTGCTSALYNQSTSGVTDTADVRPVLAVNSTYWVSTGGGKLAVTRKSDGVNLGSIAYASLFGGPTGTSGAQVLWDSTSSRWFALSNETRKDSTCSGAGNYRLAVSKTSTPGYTAADWYVYNIPFESSSIYVNVSGTATSVTQHIQQHLGLSFTTDKIVISGDGLNYPSSSCGGTLRHGELTADWITAVKKADLTSGAATPAHSAAIPEDTVNCASGCTYSHYSHISNPSGPDAYLMSFRLLSNPSYIGPRSALHTLRGLPGSGAETLFSMLVDSPFAGDSLTDANAGGAGVYDASTTPPSVIGLGYRYDIDDDTTLLFAARMVPAEPFAGYIIAVGDYYNPVSSPSLAVGADGALLAEYIQPDYSDNATPWTSKLYLTGRRPADAIYTMRARQLQATGSAKSYPPKGGTSLATDPADHQTFFGLGAIDTTAGWSMYGTYLPPAYQPN